MSLFAGSDFAKMIRTTEIKLTKGISTMSDDTRDKYTNQRDYSNIIVTRSIHWEWELTSSFILFTEWFPLPMLSHKLYAAINRMNNCSVRNCVKTFIYCKPHNSQKYLNHFFPKDCKKLTTHIAAVKVREPTTALY